MIKWLKDVKISDVSDAGGKAASLGQMINCLSSKGINVPNGFVITTSAYLEFIQFNGFESKINKLLVNIIDGNLVSLRQNGLEIRSLIENGDFPQHLEEAIIDNYLKLSMQYTDRFQKSQFATDVAVRSSSSSEDLAGAAFAGQYSSYLNVRGKYQVLESVKSCYASLYTDRAISYRKSINHNDSLKIAVIVQKMVRSDLGSAGVCFSIDSETGFKDAIVINGSWGLCELVVQGSVKPDEIIVHKKTLEKGFRSIIDKKLGDKKEMMIYSTNPNEKVKLVTVSNDKYDNFCINDDQSLKLSRWVLEIEKHYTEVYGKWTPVDVEWAIDGLSKELYIVQARPETIHSNKQNSTILREYKISKTNDIKPIVQGIAVGDKISSGRVRIIHSLDNRLEDLDFQKGDILVTTQTSPDWEPIMALSSAVITNDGGRTSHCSIVCREMGINAIVGTGDCTEVLKEGQFVTVSCAEGEIGYVYDGNVPYNVSEIDLATLPSVKTNIMFNIASPNDVFKFHNWSMVRGVGLVREEFIINNYIKVHPCALINYDKLNPNSKTKHEIDQLIKGYANPIEYYIEKLCFGLGRIASTFYPNDVIVRFSDFKSNEYRDLLGGEIYEPEEENPMIGWRGASRYYSDDFKQAFGLECLAIKRLRDEIGLTNIITMIPFCRTVEECIKVQEIMKEYGLERGVNGLQVYIMCEIPSNVIMADEFCKYVDGFSIGSNDLTQLTLGLDRDSALVAHIYNEMNPSVRKMISWAIQSCKKNGVKIGLCGQGPSDSQPFCRFLIEEGIDSVSITPDALVKTILAVHEVEQNIKN